MKVKIPLMKNCRVDYKYKNSGVTFSLLVDYMNNDRVLFYKTGVRQLKEMYQDFKWACSQAQEAHESPIKIDNSPYLPFTLYKVEGVLYEF